MPYQCQPALIIVFSDWKWICGELGALFIRLQKHILWFLVRAMAEARRWWLFFLDSHPSHVTKGQVVFSASSTAAPPGCRCACNPAGTTIPVKSVEGTGRNAAVFLLVPPFVFLLNRELFSWRQPFFFFFFNGGTSQILPLCRHTVVWEHRANVKCGLFF